PSSSATADPVRTQRRGTSTRLYAPWSWIRTSSFSWRIAAMTASPIVPASRTGPTRKALRRKGLISVGYLHEDRAGVDSHGKGAKTGRARVDPVARAHVALPLMGAAGEDAALQAPFAQRDTLVRTAVLVGVDLALDVDEEHPRRSARQAGHLPAP